MADLVLRDYQEDILARTRGAVRDGHRRVLIVSPTGSGKTVIAGGFAQNARRKQKRVLFQVHRRELVRQTSRKFSSFGIDHGLILANRSMSHSLVQVGMVQTIIRRLERMHAPDTIFTDEAHHAPAGSWAKSLQYFISAISLGLTATPVRLDGKPLGPYYDTMVLGPEVRTLIDIGHLAEFDYYTPPAAADFSKCRTSDGDIVAEDAAALLDDPTITGDVVEHYAEHFHGKAALAFCCTVQHAEDVAAEFTAAGWPAACLHGGLGDEDRERILRGIVDGSLCVVTSAELVSEGLDVDGLQGVILLRPTKSLAMFRQQVGRALRPKPDGSHAIILDHVGNSARHGLPDEEIVWSLTEKPKKKQLKQIRHCGICHRDEYGVPPDCEFGGLCGLLGGGGTVVDRVPEKVNGKLVKVDMTWAQGWSLTDPSGYALNQLIHLAGGDMDKLKAIAKARGYHWRWAKHAYDGWREQQMRKEAAE